MTPGRPAAAAGAHRIGRAAGPSGPGNAAAPIRQVVLGLRSAWPGAPRGGCDNRRMPERLQGQRAVAHQQVRSSPCAPIPGGHVAIDSSGMLMEASGNIVTKVGDPRGAHGPGSAQRLPLGLYDVTAEIITFEPDRQIAWTLHGQLDLGHVYGCRLEPVEEGTLVTSYPDWPAAQQPWKDAAVFPVISVRCGPHSGSWPALSPRPAPPRVLNPLTAAVPATGRATSTECP
jgi:hypothetical protein